MLTFGGGRIFLVAGATDMRKSFNGLAGIVPERLETNPMSRHLFFFCNRGRNRMEVLVADESGMWVLSKRLDRGTFAWPSADASAVRGVPAGAAGIAVARLRRRGVARATLAAPPMRCNRSRTG
jgi:transposase